MPNAERDAKAIKDVLEEKYHFKVIKSLFNEDATGDNIREVFDDMLQDEVKIGPKDRVLVYYAGHGKLRRKFDHTGNEIREGFIVPFNSIRDRYSSNISMEAIIRGCQRCSAKHVLLILDCCFSGYAASRSSDKAVPKIIKEQYLQDIAYKKGIQVLAAGREDQPVNDSGTRIGYSAFTGALLDLLEPGIDLDGNGIITASEIGYYLETYVANQSQGTFQRPEYAHIAGSAGGDFIFALDETRVAKNEKLGKLGAKEGLRVSSRRQKLLFISVIVSISILVVVIITILSQVENPIADAGDDQIVKEGDVVHLNGSASNDPDGRIVSYLWKQIDREGPFVEIRNDTRVIANFVAPNVLENTRLRFNLTVVDDEKHRSTPSTVNVMVEHMNRPPKANAGFNQTVTEGSTVLLNGNRSVDTESTSGLVYNWSQIGYSPSIMLSNSNKSIATFTAPSDLTNETILTFQLKVTDSNEVSNTDELSITVKPFPILNLSNSLADSSDPRINAYNESVYVVWAAAGTGDQSAAILSKSNNNGTNFNKTNVEEQQGTIRSPDLNSKGSNVYVVWNGQNSLFSEIYFKRSTDGGSTFSNPINLSNYSEEGIIYDRIMSPRIAVYGDNIYVVWQADYGGQDHRILLTNSNTSGETFSEPIMIGNNTEASVPEIAAFDNNVYVVWHNGKGNIELVRSTNRGVSFSDPITISSSANSLDPDIALFNENVYVLWEEFRSGLETETESQSLSSLMLSKSTDGGENFSDPIEIQGSHDSSFGALSVDQNNVYVVWSNITTMFLTESIDGGVKFSKPTQIFEIGSDIPGYEAGMTPDPVNVASGDGKAYVVWQEGTTYLDGGEIYFKRIK